MGKSYSLDLRSRIVGYVEAGHSRRSAARHFGVSDSFAVKLMQPVVRDGSLTPAPQGRPRGSRLTRFKPLLIDAIEKEPAELSRLLCQCGFAYKKP